MYFKSGIDLTKQLQDAGIVVLKPAAFEPGNLTPAALSTIKRSGFRIMIFMAYNRDMQAIASGRFPTDS